ncbi:MAG TPA: excinuclease ABC subunit UvrB, partial [Clostridia bacterium]|nr:excinuclease ABC subunit UvrB [Clostridia bacterium]
MGNFKLKTDLVPKGDQPKAIEALTKGVLDGERMQVLLGVTGSGKTFTMANIIEKLNRPTLVIAHNKTLAAQLCSEFREFFPDNAVEYFVSYYDYYQPEAYIPSTDTYIEKETEINEEIERMRLSATSALNERRDVIVVASVSCIYGLGDPVEYLKMSVSLRPGLDLDRDSVIRRLVDIQYQRNDIDFHRGTFRVRGDCLEVFPSYYTDRALRIEFFGDTIDRICQIDALTGMAQAKLNHVAIFPATHYVATRETMDNALEEISKDLEVRLTELRSQNKLLEAQRLEQRVRYDMEMMRELGYCSGIENYSRYLDGRSPGEPPFTLLDYFPDDYLMFIDESHVTIPQIRGMYAGDVSRKKMLVDYGFRLPAAYDNRPLRFEEFLDRMGQVICVSATPADFELERSGQVVEQIIRPTGLVDPAVEVRRSQGQIDDLIGELNAVTSRGNRSLVTTLTKKMAEMLTDYLKDAGLKVR